MKPGKRDQKYEIKIQGDELVALKVVCADMPECFGLDRRIAAYKGTRPIGFYRWDLDALVDTFDYEIMRASKPAPQPSGKVSSARRLFPNDRFLETPWPYSHPQAIRGIVFVRSPEGFARPGL